MPILITKRLPLLFCLLIFAGVIFLPSLTRAEVEIHLTSPDGYEAIFLKGDELNIVSQQDQINLQKLGSASGGVVSADRHHATLKNKEKVYYFLKVNSTERIDRIRFVMTTSAYSNPYRISASSLITQNYFKINYLDPIGSGSGYGSLILKSDSTKGRPYIVVTINGQKYAYFSFEAVAITGGIVTKIVPYFSKGPAITDIAEERMITSTAEVKDKLCDVPQPPTDLQARWYYYNSWWWRNCFKQALACRLKQVTEPFMADGKRNPITRAETLNMTVDGFTKEQANAIERNKDVRIGNAGDTATQSVAFSPDLKNVTVTFNVLNSTTGAKNVTMGERTMDGAVTSFDAVNFLGFIGVVPDTTVGEEIFDGMRLKGINTPVAVTVTVDGVHATFPCDFAQANLNLTCVNVKSPTEANFTTTGGCDNMATFAKKGTETAGTTSVNFYADKTTAEITDEVPPPATKGSEEVTMFENNGECVDLDIDSDNNNVVDEPDRTKEEDEVEDVTDDATKPGKYIIVNDNDSDKDCIVDFADGFNLDGVEGNADDITANEHFVPLILELGRQVDLSKVKIKFTTYSGSDPAKLSKKDGRYILPEGDLRIWLKDGNEKRKKESANASPAGDYVAPGIYTANQLGFKEGESVITLYVEAITFSKEAADRRILVEVDLDGGEIFKAECTDAVRLTAVEFRVIGHRGSPVTMPENTIRSFTKAVEETADAIETDLCIVKSDTDPDNKVEIILWHDPNPYSFEAYNRSAVEILYAFPVPINQVLPEDRRVPTYMLTLNQFRESYWYVKDRPKKEKLDDPIPTLGEFVAWLQKSPQNEKIRKILLDVKVTTQLEGEENVKKFVDKAYDVLPEEIRKRFVFLSGDPQVLDAIAKKGLPNFGYDKAYGRSDIGDAIKITDEKNGNFLDVGISPYPQVRLATIRFGAFLNNLESETKERTTILDNKKKLINVTTFTIDDKNEMKQLLHFEHPNGSIQGIITDEIKLLKEAFNEVYRPK